MVPVLLTLVLSWVIVCSNLYMVKNNFVYMGAGNDPILH
jgi:hypothetical protein